MKFASRYALAFIALIGLCAAVTLSQPGGGDPPEPNGKCAQPIPGCTNAAFAVITEDLKQACLDQTVPRGGSLFTTYISADFNHYPILRCLGGSDLPGAYCYEGAMEICGEADFYCKDTQLFGFLSFIGSTEMFIPSADLYICQFPSSFDVVTPSSFTWVVGPWDPPLIVYP